MGLAPFLLFAILCTVATGQMAVVDSEFDDNHNDDNDHDDISNHGDHNNDKKITFGMQKIEFTRKPERTMVNFVAMLLQ